MERRQMTAGAYHMKTIEIVKGEPLPYGDPTIIKAGAIRFLEEAVELGLACGLRPQQILVYITDALYNEAKKINKYPSEITSSQPFLPNMKVKIVDTRICIDFIREVAGIPLEQIQQTEADKLELLRLSVEAGSYTMVDNRIYKKEARS